MGPVVDKLPKGPTFWENLRSLGARLAGFSKEKYEWV